MRFLHISLFAALLALLSACGSDSLVDAGDESSNGLTGTYLSVSVTENGGERELVEGTRIQVSFEGDRISASAGCNSMGGSYTVSEAGVLEVADLSMTEMGCDGPRQEQDSFVSAFLTSSPMVQMDGDTLVLATDSTRIELLDSNVAIPDEALFDTRWTFDSFFDQSVARSVFIDEPGWLRFVDASSATGFDGCVEFDLDVATDEAGSRLEYGSRTETTTATCDDDILSYAALIDAALRGEATYEIDGPLLTITKPNGDGIILRADA